MSGGSTAKTDATTIMDTTWEIAMAGVVSNTYSSWDAGMDWSNTTPTAWGENPSLMRWITEIGLTTWGGNPYEGVSTYAPDADLERISQAISDLGAIVTQLDPSSNLGSYSDTVEGALPAVVTQESVEVLNNRVIADAEALGSTIVISAAQAAYQASLDSVISAATTAHRTRAETEHDKTAADFEVRLADIGGANSSAFAFGLAGMLNDMDDRIEEYSSRYSLQMAQQAMDVYKASFTDIMRVQVTAHLEDRRMQSQFVSDGTRQLLAAINDRVTAYQNLAIVNRDGSNASIAAKSDEYLKNLEVDVKEAEWDPHTFLQLGQLISTWSGGNMPVSDNPTMMQSALSGGMSGAGLAIMAGAGGPAIAGAIGFGALAGALAS